MRIPTALEILVLIIVVNMAFVSVPVSATSVDRLSMCNNEGYAGEMVDISITLGGTSGERIGYWRTYYKHVEGDDEKADITSWVTIIPANYTLKAGEVKEFTVRVTIPGDAKPGLYGATSEDAYMEGHSAERRTYIVFEDANATAVIEAQGSVVYSGLLIPISVNVLGKPNPLTPFIKAIQANIISIALLAIVIILLVLLLRRKK